MVGVVFLVIEWERTPKKKRQRFIGLSADNASTIPDKTAGKKIRLNLRAHSQNNVLIARLISGPLKHCYHSICQFMMIDYYRFFVWVLFWYFMHALTVYCILSIDPEATTTFFYVSKIEFTIWIETHFNQLTHRKRLLIRLLNCLKSFYLLGGFDMRIECINTK